MQKRSIQWSRIQSAKGSSCLAGAVHCVQDDSADSGMHVRKSMAAQCGASKAIR